MDNQFEELKNEINRLREVLRIKEGDDEARDVISDHWRTSAMIARDDACRLAGVLRDLLNCGNDEARERAKCFLQEHDKGTHHNNNMS